MEGIMKISEKYNIPVIEDAAQSIGSTYKGKPAGSIGHIGCFSGHPLKNLNAFGDAGYLTTDNSEIASKIRSLANHGMVERNIVENFGYVSRMDNLQAGILNYHITKLDKVINQRRANADLYKELLNKNYIYIPKSDNDNFDTYHTFVIQVDKRSELISYLENKGIQTSIHYPIPIHLQPAAKYLGHKDGAFPETEKQAKRILTLPVNQFIDAIKVEYICKAINNFYEDN
jgi:dTDP-4-amino-4,6-dideoxygalactose transaminase